MDSMFFFASSQGKYTFCQLLLSSQEAAVLMRCIDAKCKHSYPPLYTPTNILRKIAWKIFNLEISNFTVPFRQQNIFH